MSNALDFSPAKRSKAADSASSKTPDGRTFTQVGIVTDIPCGDVVCALGSPKGLLIKKSSKTGAVFYTCTNNVRNTVSSCQFSASHFRPDPASNIRCLVCTTPVNGSPSVGKLLPEKDINGKAQYDNLHLQFKDCAGQRAKLPDSDAEVLPKCTGAGPELAGKVCVALCDADPVEDIKIGCTGAVCAGDVIVKGWAQGDNPQPLHIRCAKRLWEKKLKAIVDVRKFQHQTGTTVEEEGKAPSSVATADLDDI